MYNKYKEGPQGSLYLKLVKLILLHSKVWFLISSRQLHAIMPRDLKSLSAIFDTPSLSMPRASIVYCTWVLNHIPLEEDIKSMVFIKTYKTESAIKRI